MRTKRRAPRRTRIDEQKVGKRQTTFKKTGFCTIEARILGQDRLTYCAAISNLGVGVSSQSARLRRGLVTTTVWLCEPRSHGGTRQRPRCRGDCPVLPYPIDRRLRHCARVGTQHPDGVVIPSRPTSRYAAHDVYVRFMKYSLQSPAGTARTAASWISLVGTPRLPVRVEVLCKCVGDHARRKPVLTREVGQLAKPEAVSPYPRSFPLLYRARVNWWCNAGRFPHTQPDAPQELYI